MKIAGSELTAVAFAIGVGKFFARDTFAGKPIIVRYKWTLRSGNPPRFEQAFSADDGRTWETNWTTDYTLVNVKTVTGVADPPSAR
jgi:hypothetical protein